MFLSLYSISESPPTSPFHCQNDFLSQTLKNGCPYKILCQINVCSILSMISYFKILKTLEKKFKYFDIKFGHQINIYAIYHDNVQIYMHTCVFLWTSFCPSVLEVYFFWVSGLLSASLIFWYILRVQGFQYFILKFKNRIRTIIKASNAFEQYQSKV